MSASSSLNGASRPPTGATAGLMFRPPEPATEDDLTTSSPGSLDEELATLTGEGSPEDTSQPAGSLSDSAYSASEIDEDDESAPTSSPASSAETSRRRALSAKAQQAAARRAVICSSQPS